MIRCNMCGRLFKSEDELKIKVEMEAEVIVETYKACPDCNTDAYLMDIDEVEDMKLTEEQKRNWQKIENNLPR